MKSTEPRKENFSIEPEAILIENAVHIQHWLIFDGCFFFTFRS